MNIFGLLPNQLIWINARKFRFPIGSNFNKLGMWNSITIAKFFNYSIYHIEYKMFIIFNNLRIRVPQEIPTFLFCQKKEIKKKKKIVKNFSFPLTPSAKSFPFIFLSIKQFEWTSMRLTIERQGGASSYGDFYPRYENFIQLTGY